MIFNILLISYFVSFFLLLLLAWLDLKPKTYRELASILLMASLPLLNSVIFLIYLVSRLDKHLDKKLPWVK